MGKYHFEEAGLKVDVDLNADGSARYQVNAGRAVGFWAVQGNRVHIYNKLGPVRLECHGVVECAASNAAAVFERIELGPRDRAPTLSIMSGTVVVHAATVSTATLDNIIAR
ncbi:hypothetical protein [Sphingomonas sp. OK281]|uniref:hypothetical protein n=1 Tax=Sphingomonas sp. OK281 TaxID=1881067 RepID=UPI0011132F18|nr:hypothetical protein [Sphingomonas sp. OK281]